jgi:hypothetical protein
VISGFHAKRFRALPLTLAALGFWLSGSTLLAQTQNGEIKGAITDDAGSRIPKAIVTATNQRTQIYRTVESSETGDYVIANIQPGVYRVEVTKAGFQKTLTQEVTVDVNQIATVDIQMRVGTVTETVSVAAEGAMLEAATAQLGTVITEEKIVDLPLNARNFSELVTLTPGAIPVSVGENNSPLFVAKVGQSYFPAINGQTNRSNTFTLDGIYNNGNYGGTYAVAPNIDALSEFKVQSHSDQAEFGGVTGGIVNLITKSGTNQFHGSAYEFLRNDALDARGFFTAKKPPLRQNQFGTTFGGPIKKNKTFFFFAYEGYQQRNPNSALINVPTPAQLGGDFSNQTRRIYNPFSTRINPDAPNTYLRDPFPNNIIPASMLNPSTQAWAKAVIPAPISTGFANFNQRNDDPQSFPSNQYSLRGDHQFSQSNSVWMRYLRSEQDQKSANALPGTYSLTDLPDSNAGAGYTHIFGSNTLMTALFGYSSMRQRTAPFVSSQNLIGQGLFPGLPAINAPGMGIPSAFGSIPSDTRDRGPQEGHQFGGDLSHNVNRHSLKFGAGFIGLHYYTNETEGSMAFATSQTADLTNLGNTGSDIASFDVGVMNSWTYRNRNYALQTQVIDIYAQDSWRVNDKLTVNYGLRWDLLRNPAFSKNFPSMWDFGTGKYIVGSGPLQPCSATQAAPCLSDPNNAYVQQNVVFTGSSKFRSDNYKMFGPRLGIAYRVRPTMVVRASFGIFYDLLAGSTQQAQNPVGNWPNTQLLVGTPNQNVVTATANNIFGGNDPRIPAATPLASYNYYYDPKIKDPYSEQWQCEIQKEIGGSAQLNVGYVGSHNLRLTVGGDYNTALTPGPGPVMPRALWKNDPVSLWDRSVGQSKYDALQVKFDKRFSKGLAFLLAYTWSKSMDVASSGQFNDEGFSLQNPYDPNGSRSVSGFNVPHYFSAALVYDSPFGHGKRWLNSGIASRMLGNWQVNSILVLRSGQPFTLATNADIANIGAIGGSSQDRPNLVGDPHLANPSPTQWFNKAAYAIPAAYTFGTSGRNQLWTESAKNVDVSLFRQDSLTEWLRLQFRVEAFNIFNHPTFGTPQTLITSPSFAAISGTISTARQIQLGMKLIF